MMPRMAFESVHMVCTDSGLRTLCGGRMVEQENMEEVRKLIVENFRERMQLRRSLIELEDQNVQNSIEVGGAGGREGLRRANMRDDLGPRRRRERMQEAAGSRCLPWSEH